MSVKADGVPGFGAHAGIFILGDPPRLVFGQSMGRDSSETDREQVGIEHSQVLEAVGDGHVGTQRRRHRAQASSMLQRLASGGRISVRSSSKGQITQHRLGQNVNIGRYVNTMRFRQIGWSIFPSREWHIRSLRHGGSQAKPKRTYIAPVPRPTIPKSSRTDLPGLGRDLRAGGHNGRVWSLDWLRAGGRNGWFWRLCLTRQSAVSSNSFAVYPQFARYTTLRPATAA